MAAAANLPSMTVRGLDLRPRGDAATLFEEENGPYLTEAEAELHDRDQDDDGFDLAHDMVDG